MRSPKKELKRGEEKQRDAWESRETEKAGAWTKDGKCDRRAGRKNRWGDDSKKVLNRWRTTVGALLGALDPATAGGRGGGWQAREAG